MIVGKLDHWIWTVPDLATGAEQIRTRLGPTYFGGRHDGLGSANHILPLGDDRYLEVLGPSNDLGSLGCFLKTSTPRLAAFAIRVADLERVACLAIHLGLQVDGPRDYSRFRSDGAAIRWRLLQLYGHGYGDYVPFFIDWGTTVHPSAVEPSQTDVASFAVDHPSEGLANLYCLLGIPVTIRQGEPRMTLTLRTPHAIEILEGSGESDLLANTRRAAAS